MQSSPMFDAPVSVQPRRTFKSLLLGLVGVAALCACLFQSGALSAPLTGSLVTADYVQSPVEKMTAEEIAAMGAIAQRILEDPAKLQLLARRIKEVFADPKFVEKMKMEMAKLQNDEEIYNWLLMTQGSDEPRRLAAAFQVQPAAFRGATSVVPRSNAQMVSTVAAKKGAFDPTEFAKTLPGITEPLGFFDPLGFCSGLTEKPATEGKVRFYREVELKHCRVAMLATVGWAWMATGTHFNGMCSVKSGISFADISAAAVEQNPIAAAALVPGAGIWQMVFAIGALEVAWENKYPGATFAGNFGVPAVSSDPAKLKELQTMELKNGRLAMIGIISFACAVSIPGSVPFYPW